MLNSEVLVLNRFYQAVNVTTAKRALTLLYKDLAKAVAPDHSTYTFKEWRDVSERPDLAGHELVATVTFRIAIPRVVLLIGFDRLPHPTVKFTRRNIYLRDRNTCQYCGQRFDSKDLNLDHVVPLSRGGQSTWENTVCSCIACNARKGSRLLNECGLRLIVQPRRPRWFPFLRLERDARTYPIWRNYLDYAYWNVELTD
ncbi:MAG TPA: HNH endonuclease [Acidobacteriota bacterium]|jgi:5-methylcytosine-specific restriction endonuclease McrA